METFAEELNELVDKWRGFVGTTDEQIINALMDEIDKLDPPDDD
jgi:hypothetical protein